MKKVVQIFLLLLCIKASSQQTLEINKGQLKLYSSNSKISMQPYTHIKMDNYNGGLFYIYQNNVSEQFYFKNIGTFIVNGVAAPITLTSIYDSLVKYQAISNISGTSQPLSSGAATSSLQQTQVDTAAAANSTLKQLLSKPVGSDSFFIKQNTDSLISKLTTSIALPTNAVKALNVRQVQTTALVGANIPTVTAYTTAANTVVTTNCTEIVLENMSTTTNATFSYGGQTFTLGFKGNGITPSFYHLKAPYDASSFRYSPFATLIVNAASSSVFVTRYFIQ